MGAHWSGYLALDRLRRLTAGRRRIQGGLNASEWCTGFHGDTVLQCLQPPNSAANLSSPSFYSSTGPLYSSSSNVNVGGWQAGEWSLLWWFSTFPLCSYWSFTISAFLFLSSLFILSPFKKFCPARPIAHRRAGVCAIRLSCCPVLKWMAKCCLALSKEHLVMLMCQLDVCAKNFHLNSLFV